MRNAYFYIGVAMLFTHELDAIPNHEWRVLPLLGSMTDELASNVFILAHVPIFAIVIAFIASLDVRIRRKARIVASAILVLHGVLHTVFTGHEAYEFASVASLGLIYGASALGLLYLITEIRWNRWSRDENA